MKIGWENDLDSIQGELEDIGAKLYKLADDVRSAISECNEAISKAEEDGLEKGYDMNEAKGV